MEGEHLVLEGRYVVYKHPQNLIEVDTGEETLDILGISPTQVMGENVDVELWRSTVKGVVIRIVGTKLYSDGERYIVRG